MSDKEILRELETGNEACLKHLYTHLKMVESWVIRNSGDTDDARDLFQDAMVVFYKNLMSGKYQYNGKISTYLFEICKRNWLNHLNRRAKFEQRGEDVNNMHIEDNAFEVELTNPGISLQQYLENALNKLGEPCRSLLEKTIFLKKKMEELAVEFGYSDAHSARQQRYRCIKRLRGLVSYELIIQLI